MKYTSILEKMLCLFELVRDSWMDLTFLGVALLFIVLLGFKKISRKQCFILVFIACAALIGYTVYSYYGPLSAMMNAILDNMFTSIYFPSVYVYLFVLVVVDILTLGNLLYLRGERIYKTINGICFIVMNFVLTLILEIVAKNEIDIFSKESLFSNTNLVTLLEFSVNIFIVWLIALIAIQFVNIITERIMVAKENRVLEKSPATTDMNSLSGAIEVSDLEENYLHGGEVVSPKVSVEPVQFIPTEPIHFVPEEETNRFIPSFSVSEVETTNSNDNYEVKENLKPKNVSRLTSDFSESQVVENTFDLSSFIPKKQDVRPIQALNTEANGLFEQILNNELPVIREEKAEVRNVDSVMAEKNTYTLNDYRIFNKMLKDIREHNHSNAISIDKDLEYRLITKYSTETYRMFQKMLQIYSN